MIKLSDIIDCNYDTLINDIKTDSRDVLKNDLFVAVKGYNVDHNDYIDDAINNGASAIISENEILDKNIPCIKVDDIDNTLNNICKKFYSYNNTLSLIGITGTDGKTTTATILNELLNKKELSAYLGTNGLLFNNKYESTSNTTPNKETLYKIFSNLEKNNCKNVVMEVSSEALLHKRVNSFKYKYQIFTNISEDHLNIHKSKENYISCKLSLLDQLDSDGIAIINKDDDVLQNINTRHKIYTYGTDIESDFVISNIILDNNGSKFNITYKENVYKIESPYPFIYNIYNLCAAFIVCYLEGMDTTFLINKIKKLKTVPGRCEIIKNNKNYNIILDYAHTENGIRNLVKNVKFYNKKIIVVTGAAGGREKEKRERIGNYLLNNVDLVIFTMDDPRYEDVNDIIDQMIGDSKNKNYKRIVNRSDAIKYALDITDSSTYLLIIGKGRDNYMAIEDKKKPYSDYDVITKYLNS